MAVKKSGNYWPRIVILMNILRLAQKAEERAGKRKKLIKNHIQARWWIFWQWHCRHTVRCSTCSVQVRAQFPAALLWILVARRRLCWYQCFSSWSTPCRFGAPMVLCSWRIGAQIATCFRWSVVLAWWTYPLDLCPVLASSMGTWCSCRSTIWVHLGNPCLPLRKLLIVVCIDWKSKSTLS